MLVATQVVDDETAITVRPGFLDIDGFYIVPVTSAAADRLAEQAGKVAEHMREAVARSMTEPMFDGPVAAISESELRLLAGDR